MRFLDPNVNDEILVAIRNVTFPWNVEFVCILVDSTNINKSPSEKNDRTDIKGKYLLNERR